MDEIGKRAEGPGTVYLVGGATALLLGIREQTIDVDIKLDPQPKAVFECIAVLKNRLSINVELASPDRFIPELPGWRERSEFIVRRGQVDFFHYDFYAQALAKLLRGHSTDISDAQALVELGKVKPEVLQELFSEIRKSLIRYPAISPNEFETRVRSFLRELNHDL